MKKEEFIARYGEAAWQKVLERNHENHKRYREAHREELRVRSQEWYKANKDEHNESVKRWNDAHPDEVKANNRRWQETHRESRCQSTQKYRETHPDEVEALRRERARKGGKYYQQMLRYHNTGLPRERKRVRTKHARLYRQYKMIIAPDSEIHHEWIPDTAKYTGMALVETDAHRHGFIDVIELLDGKITLLTEEQIRNGGL